MKIVAERLERLHCVWPDMNTYDLLICQSHAVAVLCLHYNIENKQHDGIAQLHWVYVVQYLKVGIYQKFSKFLLYWPTYGKPIKRNYSHQR